MTFARGKARSGKPAHPPKPGELLEAVSGALRVLAYEDLVVERPWPAPANLRLVFDAGQAA